MSPDKLVDENDPSALVCHDKSGPGKIHEVILAANYESYLPASGRV